MLTANLWVGTGLVNSVIRIITDVLYKEKPEYTSLLTAILVSFDQYCGLTFINLNGILIVSIVPI